MYEVAAGRRVISKSWLPEFPLWQLPQLDSLGAPVMAAGGVGTFATALRSLGPPARIATASRMTTASRVASFMTTPSSVWKDTLRRSHDAPIRAGGEPLNFGRRRNEGFCSFPLGSVD